MFCPSEAFLVKPTGTQMVKKDKGMRLTCQATSIPADRVPAMGKRQLMNCFCWGLFHSPQVSCCFLMQPSLSQLGGEVLVVVPLPRMQLEMMSLLLNGLRLMAPGPNSDSMR